MVAITYTKACNLKVEKQGERCTFTGRYDSYSLDRVHIIRRSYSKPLINNPRNIIPGSRWIHDIFDNRDYSNASVLELVEQYPWRMKAVLYRMRDLDLYYYRRYCKRNNLSLDENDSII